MSLPVKNSKLLCCCCVVVALLLLLLLLLFCRFVLVVVEWLHYSKRIIISKRADFSEYFSLIFVGKMCVFISRPMNIVTFLRKNGDPAKRVVDFPLERDTFRNKIMEIVKDFDEKSYNNNGKHPGNRKGLCV